MALKLGTLHISSPAFGPLQRIPQRYAGDGENISPPLEWRGTPQGTQQFALVCFDPDAPRPQGFTHWVVYSIPASATGITEGQHAFVEGVNSFGKVGYGGPMPPQGHGPHHYYFWLYALDAALPLQAGLTREQLMDAVSDHVIAQARLVGLYER